MDETNIRAGKGYSVGFFGFLATAPGLLSMGNLAAYVILALFLSVLAQVSLRHVGVSSKITLVGFSVFVFGSGILLPFSQTNGGMAGAVLIGYWLLFGLFFYFRCWASIKTHLAKSGGSIV
ncbi:hypothetical protein FHR99_000131 [Litorivivens lipolytica]|uniref:Uncharacterized protein n=1 Tax=Litorivivens lipolytica TaxID=1524264 RepID=A0A7W4W1W5_9GAMM|nr:hypothetical protein [Litorivivens lipolytica]MBB3045895.1 hypothetical protein [Litorivivens lipolytica]